MSVQSTQVGFRIRGIEPPELSTFPDRIKLMFWGWVTEAALRKDKELARGWDKNGNVHPLKPQTIRYRKSEVGPVHPNAPRLIPALNLSRVRSLLTGRAHTTSSELWWKFDAVTGRSFAVVLHYAAEAGHDVFGLSPTGTAWVAREATKKWQAWIAGGGGIRATKETADVKVSRKPEFRQPVKTPIPKVEVRQPVQEGRPDSLCSGRQNVPKRAGKANQVWLHRLQTTERCGRAVEALRQGHDARCRYAQ